MNGLVLFFLERRHSRRYSSSSDMELASPEHAARRRRRTRSASSGGSSPAPGRSRNRSRSSSESHSPLKLPSLAPPGPVPMEVDTVDGEPSLTAGEMKTSIITVSLKAENKGLNLLSGVADSA